MNTKTITRFPDAPDIESSTRDYAGRFAGEVGAWLLRQQEEATRQAITAVFGSDQAADGQRLRVLDVGGGHGQNIALMRELGHELVIVGSDPSCSELIKPAIDSGDAQFQVASLLDLPFDDNSFDLVICYRILSHMASWEALLAELKRVTRKLVLVDYPSRASINALSGPLYSVKRKIEKNTRPYGCFSDREIDETFARLDFRPVYRYRQFFLPMALYRLIDNLSFSKTLGWFFRKIGVTAKFGSPVIAGYGHVADSATAATGDEVVLTG